MKYFDEHKFSVKFSLIDFFLLWLELCICLLRNLYAGQEAAVHVNVWQKPLQYCKVISLQLIKKKKKKKQQLELGMEQQTGFKLGEEYIKAVYCHPAYLTYMQSTSWEMPGWMNTSWNQDCWEKYQ